MVEQAETLSNIVHIARHYQRSIRIDADLGRSDALEGYVCHATATTTIESMCRQLRDSSQRAFTWTGPFGGGKSSLAVALASAIGPDKNLRIKARKALGLAAIPDFDKAFPTSNGWLVIPVVGRRASIAGEIAKALHRATGADSRKRAGASVITELCEASEDKRFDGVLLIIDEMGKFLEAAALGSGDDVYFFQELAEAAARASGKIAVIGILHQSFAQYAAKQGIDTRDDWAKVQGRYSDIPLVAASDEVVELIGRALEVESKPSGIVAASEAVSEVIRSRRPSVGAGFAQSLEACWPLHPTMAALLGPISKRQFGQNERSTFGFLASAEPLGFRSFLETTPACASSWYRPDNYWDYLRANLEPAILASPDGHRWAQAVEAVERAEAKTGDDLHVALIKNIAVIDLFRNGSGLAAETKVLASLFPEKTKNEIDAALEQLSKWRVVIFKKHISAWSVFEGSDFDIDSAVAQARATLPGVDFELLSKLANLYPVIAKRHYHQTGTMRWMDVTLCRMEEARQTVANFEPREGAFGLFLLALPAMGSTQKAALRDCQRIAGEAKWPVVIGVPPNHARIDELGAELLSLQAVQARHELSGDAVARREVAARLSAVRCALEEQLAAALTSATWIAGETKVEPGEKLSPMASSIADWKFEHAPQVWSELVNRDKPSSNSVKARRDLLYRMLDSEGEQFLGISGFPAERGLYETLLRRPGLHRQDNDGEWRFLPPDEKDQARFAPLWEATKALFGEGEAKVSVADIYALWANPPFGVKAGVMPVILTAFLLAHKANVAVYKDGVFVPRVTDADIDEYLQDEGRFALRWITIDEDKTKILSGIAEILASVGEMAAARDPLEAARGLVSMTLDLPAWTQRTQCLSSTTKEVRDTLLKASDPHKVLFVDLPAALGGARGAEYVEALRGPVKELSEAYGRMLKRIESSMLESLDAPPERLDRLRARAEAVAGVTGDLRQDAFSARLAKHDGSKESIEGLMSLAANRPPRDWNDRDIDAALLEVAGFALRFRHAEALVSVRGRKPTSEAFAVVIGAGKQTQTLAREFDVPDRHREKVDALALDLARSLKEQGLGADAMLAVLAKAGLSLAEDNQGG